LDEVPEYHGHTDEGERHNDQELPHVEVKVPTREVCVVERLEEVVIVVPHDTKDVQLIDHAGINEVLEEEWAQHGGRRSVARMGHHAVLMSCAYEDMEHRYRWPC
jgi:hypothetical protein